jgi:hypothetical protein
MKRSPEKADAKTLKATAKTPKCAPSARHLMSIVKAGYMEQQHNETLVRARLVRHTSRKA